MGSERGGTAVRPARAASAKMNCMAVAWVCCAGACGGGLGTAGGRREEDVGGDCGAGDGGMGAAERPGGEDVGEDAGFSACIPACVLAGSMLEALRLFAALAALSVIASVVGALW